MTHLAVFDWNGTLFDDTLATHKATNECLAFFDIPPITLEEEQEHFTFPLIHFYEKVGVSADDYLKHAEEVGHIFISAYNRYKAECSLAAGAIALLDWLRAQNVTCIILSNLIQDILEKDVHALGIAPYFETISGNHDPATIVSGLSKQDRLQEYMDRNQSDPAKIFRGCPR